MTLEEVFLAYKQSPAGIDIRDHMDTLRWYASNAFCSNIVEFGVRSGFSTISFLAGHPCKLTSYDVDPFQNAFAWKKMAQEEGIEFQFVRGDSRLVEIEPCHLLFIDTLHERRQLDTELSRHGDKVQKYIIMHDTHQPNDDNGHSGEMQTAILWFLYLNRDWCISRDYRNCNGLTVLERIG